MVNKQKQKVQGHKVSDGWVGGYTTRTGFILYRLGFVVPSNNFIDALTSHIIQTNTTSEDAIITLFPQLYDIETHVPPDIQTNASQSVKSFGRICKDSGNGNNDDIQSAMRNILMVYIYGINYNRDIYDDQYKHII